MKCRTCPLSLLPSQFLGMKSPIRYGLGAACFAETFCSAALMLLNLSILPLNVSFISAQLLHHICHFLSQLLLKCDHICCGDHVCSHFCGCWSCCCRGLSKVSERFHP